MGLAIKVLKHEDNSYLLLLTALRVIDLTISISGDNTLALILLLKTRFVGVGVLMNLLGIIFNHYLRM